MRNLTTAAKPKVSQKEIATPACNNLTKKQTLVKKRTLSYTQKLTYTASLTAIALILKIVSQMLGGAFQLLGLKLSLVYIPWIIAAAALGPLSGMAVAFTADALGTFLLPTTGNIMPLILLSNTLFPLFVALAVKLLPTKNLYFKTVIGTAVSCLVCTLGLSTLGLSILYGVPFFVQLSLRTLQPVVIMLNLAIVGLLLPVLKKLRFLPQN